MEIEKYITVSDAMALLNCSDGGVRYYVEKGMIRKVGEKSRTRYLEADVLRLKEKRALSKQMTREKRLKIKEKTKCMDGFELQRIINKQILRTRQNGRKC